MDRTTPPARRCCIFCGKSPTTAEHIVPRWAADLIARTKPPPSGPDKVVRAVYRRWSEGANKDVDQQWLTGDAPQITVKCVCAECNHGWMSMIEASAQPIVAAMIEDQRITLDTGEQEKVAKWLGLKAIVAQYGLPQGQISPEWTHAFAIEKCPPTSWQIRIARYQGAVPMFWTTTPLDTTVIHQLVPFPMKRPGFLFIAQLGHFVGQVLGMRQQAWLVPVRCFIEIWPHPLLRANSPDPAHIASVTWPPEVGLDESDLKKCAHDPAEPKK
jgi:hypothetical protein